MSELDGLIKRVRGKLRGGEPEVVLTAAEAGAVFDELGRLLQSSDRLRRQNRRLRLKLQRAGIVDDTPAEGDDA